MKATFLISTPRSGTLALANIMNTPSCLAHHEGNDYGILSKSHSGKFKDTYAGSQLTEAFNTGKNYFCCDQSMAPYLLEMLSLDLEFMEWLKQKEISISTISMIRASDEITNSYMKLMEASKDQFNQIEKSIQDTSLAAVMLEKVSVSRILKNNVRIHNGGKFEYFKSIKFGYFKESMIHMISFIVGADLEAMPSASKDHFDKHYSLTKEEMNNGINKIRESLLV